MNALEMNNMCLEIFDRCDCKKLNKPEVPLLALYSSNSLTLHVSVNGLESHIVDVTEGLICTECRHLSIQGSSFTQIFKPTKIYEIVTVENLRILLENIKIVDKERNISYDPKGLAWYCMSSASPIKNTKIQLPALLSETAYTNKLVDTTRVLSIAGHWKEIIVFSSGSTKKFDISPNSTETILSIFDNCFTINNEEMFNKFAKSVYIRDTSGTRYTLSCKTTVDNFSLRSKETRDRLTPYITLKLTVEA